MSPTWRWPYCRSHPAAVPEEPAFEARTLTVRYPGAHGVALDGVNWRVAPGARVALIGPNGSGKSTLLKAAAGLLPAAAGQARVGGLPAGACRHRVAYLPQRSEVDWRFPVSLRGLVLAGRYVHLGWLGRPGRRDHEIAAAAIARLGLTELADRQIGELSGGQQQRALLARALTQRAELLLLDEPLNAVDAETCAVISGLLTELQREGATVLVATHDLDQIQGGFDDLLRLLEGRVVRSGVPGRSQTTRELEAAWAG